MTLSYLWERFWQKLPGAAIRDSKLESPVKIGAQSTVIHTEMGRYSYCGFAINKTPSVPGPQWLLTTPPARVSNISVNTPRLSR